MHNKCDIPHSKTHKETKCGTAADTSHQQNVYEYLHNHWQAWGRPQSPTFLPVSNCMSFRSLTDVPCISRRLEMPIWIHCTFYFSFCNSWNEKQHWTTTSFAVQQKAGRNVSMRYMASNDWKIACMTVCIVAWNIIYGLAKGFICVHINMLSGWLICLNSTDLNIIFISISTKE